MKPNLTRFCSAVGCRAFVLLLLSCEPSKPMYAKFEKGQIVKSKLTDEKLIVLGITNRPFVPYGEKYDVRNEKGEVIEMLHFELVGNQ